jgi:hypothetical protein
VTISTQAILRVLGQIDGGPDTDRWLRANATAVEGVLVEVLAGRVAGVEDVMMKTALSWLGRTGGPRAVPVLARFLNHRNVAFRLNATRALGQIGGTAATEALAGHVKDTKVHPTEAIVALEELVKLGGELERGFATALRDRYLARSRSGPGVETERARLDQLLAKAVHERS